MPADPPIRFLLDGEVIEARDLAATTTVLDYLRDTLGRRGTKEGCAEGDCGACTVVLGSLDDNDTIRYRAINSCIRFVPTIDGHELITVESLQDGGALHPVQQAMVDEHASQCGFCTPGFVMSLFALYLNQATADAAQVVDSLAGNLCRCTGYRPIIAAGCRMSGYPSPARWSRDDAHSPARVAALKSLRRPSALSQSAFTAPHTVEALARILEEKPDALILAGGTDVGLWVTKQLRTLPPIVYIGAVPELQQVRVTNDAITIGAAVTLTDAWQVIVAHFPRLADLARRFASPPVCNSGTLGGNVANASPVGDSMPALIALGARVELRRGAQSRTLPLEDFYLAYQKKDLQPGEFVTAVTIPLTATPHHIGCYKVSKRFDQDIAAVCGAFVVELAGKQVRDARIAFGGMAATPARARHAEAALIGQPWTPQTIRHAATRLATDFNPLSDLRAGSDYRLSIAMNLLQRYYLERTAPSTRLQDLAPVT